ncbi:MAG: hypothetical protein IKT98_06645 [Selenomonadaceae bacterium]|nr:hypothetical protein [Selenomonadaceae bacterium]
MKRFLATVILMLSLTSFACADDGNKLAAEPARNLSTSVDEFGWNYFATLDLNENIFYSPYSINTALSILANGASGDTLKEILSVLAADNVQNLNDCHKNFSEFAAKKYDNFAASNLLLIDKKIIGQGLDENFRSVVNDIYKSDVREADFEKNLRDEKEKIMHFVSEKTSGFIPDYKSIATDATLTDLLNVVYFKGKWTMPFNENSTRKQDFKNRDGSINKVDMMFKVFEDSIVYREDDKFKGIKLSYGDGAAMYLILPVDDNAWNVAELWNNETIDARADFLNSLKTSYEFDGEVIVRLPKFELDIENNLVESFKAMGMKKSFSDTAEFFNIVKGTPLKIDNAQHRAKVKVDESGTEAAAVTEITMVKATAAPSRLEPRRVYFIAERPFLFVIRDIESDVTLFTGVVNKF